MVILNLNLSYLLSRCGLISTKVIATFIAALFIKDVLADEVTFNPSALEIDNNDATPIDLSQFSIPGGQAPGTYHVDIYINGTFMETRDIAFKTNAEGKLSPQLTIDQLNQWGVNVNSAPALREFKNIKVVSNLKDYFPEASTVFDFQRQMLNIFIPQAAMKSTAQGTVDPKLWDQGITALLLSYGFTGARTWQEDHMVTDNFFLNMHSGLNVKGWRLRNYSTLSSTKSSEGSNSSSGTDDNQQKTKWSSINTFAQHDLSRIKGNIILGENYTSSSIFDGIPFRGVQIASDDNMLPDSLKGFAPTIRGIAHSNAQITIKQNGNVIYQTYVSAGAFIINDLYPTSSSGNLLVTVKESDGSEHSFTQSFSSVPVMQREGSLKYSLTVGKYRSENISESPDTLEQVGLIYGLPHALTIYSGFQNIHNYRALAVGLGFGLGEWGSLSIDGTRADTTFNTSNDNVDKTGESYRFQYSKNIATTDSTITLAGYRYSTRGFYTLQEAMDGHGSDNDDWHFNKRSKLQLELSQNIMGGDWGSLSFSGYQQDYWNTDGYERNITVSYNNCFTNGTSWSVMFTSTQYTNSISNKDQQVAINFSVPFSKWLPGVYINNNTTSDLHGGVFNQTGISGVTLNHKNLSYNVSQGYGNNNQGVNGQAGIDYKGSYGEANAGYNYDKFSRQFNYGLQGSLVIHPHGVTFGQPLFGDMNSLAIVEAPGADDVTVSGGTGISTDWRGYTIVPYLSSYKRSRIALDPSTLKDNVELQNNVVTVVPTAGAVVAARFAANIGSRVLMTLTHGKHTIPFGSTVSIENRNDLSAGIADDNGVVYLSGVPQQGRIIAKWGTGRDQYCYGDFNLTKSADIQPKVNIGVTQMNVVCR